MLSRAERKGLPPDSPFRVEVQEVRAIAQSTIEKIRSLSQVLHPTVLDDGGLEKAIDWYLPTFQKQTGIVVKYEKTGRSPAVPDRVAINVYRVLQEALNNLAKHSESQTAWVRVQFSQDRLQLEVEDHGIGIPERNGSNQRQGTGMWPCASEPSCCTARVEFLRPAERRNARPAGHSASGGQSSMSSEITVLLVDDHALVRKGFRRMVEDDPDIRIVGEASTGSEAVRLAQELNPQVIVMDMAMPEMDGVQATREILKHLPKTAILMLSMYAQENYVRNAFDAGAQGYI